MALLEILRSVPHFGSLSAQDLGALAQITDVWEFNPDQVLWREGEAADWLLLLRDGEVDVIYQLQDGTECVIDTAEAGELIGWSALVAPNRHTGTCIARRTGWGLRIRAEGIRLLCERDRTLGYTILLQVVQALSSRLRSARMQLAGIPVN